VSPSVGGISIWISMTVFTCIYGVPAIIGGILIYRIARPKSDAEPHEEETAHAY